MADIKVKEQTIENLMKGNKKFEPPRFMTVCQAAQQLMEIVESKSTSKYLPLIRLNKYPPQLNSI